jgi:hypothetical protein
MLKPVYDDVNDFNCNDLYLHAVAAPAGHKILKKCHEIAHMLIEKNISYGNSALEPLNIFSKQNEVQGLEARIDDKLNRIKNNQTYGDEGYLDAIKDLIGYLILLQISLDDN